MCLVFARPTPLYLLSFHSLLFMYMYSSRSRFIVVCLSHFCSFAFQHYMPHALSLWVVIPSPCFTLFCHVIQHGFYREEKTVLPFLSVVVSCRVHTRRNKETALIVCHSRAFTCHYIHFFPSSSFILCWRP